jgi:hypothetical protein
MRGPLRSEPKSLCENPRGSRHSESPDFLPGTQVKRLAFRRLSNPTVRFDVDDCIIERFVQNAGSLLRSNDS